MVVIDPRIKFLAGRPKEELIELESLTRFAVEAERVPSPKIKVLLRYSGNFRDIEGEGFETRTVAGDVASGVIELGKLDRIAALSNVIMVESSRPMTKELDISVPEIRADLVHSTPPGYRGSGVIVATID